MPRTTLEPPLRAIVLLLALALASGCGPTTRESSVAVLLVAGPIVVLANAFAWLLWRLWRSVRPELDLRWRPFVAVGVSLSLLGSLATTLPGSGSATELPVLALWLVGTSYMTVFLLVWRIRLPAPHGLAWAHAIAGTLMFLPALPLAFVGGDQPLFEALLFWWTLPGYGGLVSGALYVGLLVEALVRWRSARAVESAVESLDR